MNCLILGALSAGLFANAAFAFDTPVDVKSLGAACDGATVDNAAFEKALQTGKEVTVPRGRCVVDSLELPSNAHLHGAGGGQSVIVAGPSGRMFLITGTPTAHKSSIEIEGLAFASAKNVLIPGKFAITAKYVDNLTVRNNTSNEIQMLQTNPGFPYANVQESWLNRNTTFSNNQCKSSQQEHDSCAGFFYVDGVTADSNRVEGFRQGLFYWGGDADKNGNVGNPRWARNISFTGNTVEHSGAGVWGSMGQGIRFIRNVIAHIGDVGLDFEGTVSGLAQDNSCDDAKNGDASIFFLNRDIVFTQNTLTQPSAKQPLFRQYNASMSPTNLGIVVSKNTMKCNDPSGICTVDNANGPSKGLKFLGNTLVNTIFDFSLAVNQGDIDIEDNSFTFDRPLQGPAIKMSIFGGTMAHVMQNKIISQGAPQSTTAIVLKDTDFNQVNNYHVGGNTVRGFAKPLDTQAAGGNPGVKPAFSIKN